MIIANSSDGCKQRFDSEELQLLCFRLGIPFDDLRGETRSAKALALLGTMAQHDRLEELIETARSERAGSVWPPIPDGFRPPASLDPPAAPARLSRREARERRNELALLAKVRSFWIEGVLQRSVPGTARLELGKQEQTDCVERSDPRDAGLGLPDEPGPASPTAGRIIDLFDEMEAAGDRGLLILGAPGAGKTMTLLELARDTLARAERNPGEPLPVVFNLAAWAEWLVDELNGKYRRLDQF